MTRSIKLLIAITTTVGVSLLVAWLVVQAVVIRPAIADREQARIAQLLDAVEQVQKGIGTKEIERRRGIDLRLFNGRAGRPPPGSGWVRQTTSTGRSVWKREGGRYEIAAWTGHTWVVIQEHLPVTTTLLVALGGGALPIIVLMFGLGQRATRNQREAEERLAQMAEGRLEERLNEDVGSREARHLAMAVNRMAEQLQALFESDRRRMAGLSHELRTPLTRIRLELELARREGGARDRLDHVEHEIEAFDAMLAEMLELSRLELVGESVMKREPVDLSELAREVVEAEVWEAVEILGTGTAIVDKTLTKRIIQNLVRNSLRHAPTARRWIEVTDGALSVGDDGPGIPDGQHDAALRPFERGEASTGDGLGLAIVQQIASLHGGSVDLSPPPGLVVTVTLPHAGSAT